MLPLSKSFIFAGYLLPRMSRFGWGAPFLSCFLFAVYHFWQPYNLPTIFLLCLPMVIAAWKTRDVRVSVLVHMILNVLGAVATMLSLLRGH